jgi:hypothetical protein
MNISNGISEINFPGAAYGTQKVWLWPVYNAGKIDPVFRVSRETDGQKVNNNVPPHDRERVIDETQKRAGQIYSSQGSHIKSLCSPSGSLFDAYV